MGRDSWVGWSGRGSGGSLHSPTWLGRTQPAEIEPPASGAKRSGTHPTLSNETRNRASESLPGGAPRAPGLELPRVLAEVELLPAQRERTPTRRERLRFRPLASSTSEAGRGLAWRRLCRLGASGPDPLGGVGCPPERFAPLAQSTPSDRPHPTQPGRRVKGDTPPLQTDPRPSPPAPYSSGRSCSSSSTGAKRSPCCSTRSSTAPASKASGAPSPESAAASTSSQRSGVETVGRSRARRL